MKDSVPHGALLPLCDAVMHAGGAGTTSAALLAGVPQLLCPLHFDQFSWVRSVPQKQSNTLATVLQACVEQGRGTGQR